MDEVISRSPDLNLYLRILKLATALGENTQVNVRERGHASDDTCWPMGNARRFGNALPREMDIENNGGIDPVMQTWSGLL